MTVTAADCVLRAARDGDLPVFMHWIADADAARRWGGPGFRFPCTDRSFREDTHWARLGGYTLEGPADGPLGFGQLYEYLGRVHLARLIVRPDDRGRGLGRQLVDRLLAEGARRWPGRDASLFVYRDNAPALACYRAAGFRRAPMPHDRAALAASCCFLTRPSGTPTPEPD